ncbi:hypothetical protein BHF71_09060 [Vulcanibacillus modesticaldus]|uniref:AAA domain-containing protein n=1 Tax=Vulcanibacillus modesticaldus TaxID=337097 RepID=A0A1D2YUR1_9BACI|nr:hypothetical protein [Vulcanibacillus modesticaldus]OEF99450.1 hypothetical protein BHF71_09060 [Vulcanibacillus modesticaldus]
MDLALICNDSGLQKAFEQTGYFKVSINNTLEDLDESKILVISDREISYNELFHFFEMKKNYPKNNQQIFYILSDVYREQITDNIISIGKTRSITIIPPKLTTSQIVRKVLEKVFPDINDESKNIITFFGADSKVGTTMIAQSTAEMLANRTDLKIGLLFLNGNPSTNYLMVKRKTGLDYIKIKLINNILKPEEMIESCYKSRENLYVLPGIDYLLDVRYYHPENVERLIQLANEKFNLVIIDAGSNIDSGLAIAALNATKYKYLVTTQQEITRKNFERLENQIFKRLQIESGEFMLVVNKYLKSRHIYSASQIADLYKMMLATYIPHLEFLGWQAEYDHKTLLNYDNEDYNRQIEQLSKIIANQIQISFKENLIKKDGIFKKAMATLGGLM